MYYPAGQMTFINLDRRTTLVENARLAGTSSERRQGLMGIEGFAHIPGLWIIPCEAIHTFGMRMPIDSIFLDRKLRVRGLRSNLKPRRIAVCLLAHSVLELPAGTIEQSGTALGDCLSILRESSNP